MKSLIGMLVLGGTLAVSACGDNRVDPDRRYLVEPRATAADTIGLHANETPELRRLINKYAAEYDVPADLVHRVVIRESRHRPGARNGPYYGLMQMLPATARGMGYKGGASGLLDAETNLKYGVKYLRGAWLVSRDGTLSVTDTHDAGTEVTAGIKPLLVIDVWEHAYYIDRKNLRPAYVDAVVDELLNWDFAAENLARETTWTYPA